jgi:putative transposase
MSTSVMQAYRFALDPTPSQVRDLERHAGAARFAHNWALAAVKANLGQRAAEATYDVAADEQTPALGWNLPALRRAWNRAKGEVAPWWAQCSKEAFNTGLDGVARALRNFGDSRAGKRAGRMVGFPRFKARRRTTPSVRFTTGVIRVEGDRTHVTLPRIGMVKTHESTRKLTRRIEQGSARILSATVRREAGRWFCSFTCEVQHAQRAPTRPDLVVGVDLGITHLAVLSSPVPGVSDADGFVPNPRHLGSGATRPATRVAAGVPSCRPGPAHWAAALETLGEGQPTAQHHPPPGHQPAPGRAAQAHHRPGRRDWCRRGRGLECGRDAPQSPACPVRGRRQLW